MVLNRDFKEFFQSLNDRGVLYLVIGAYAVAFHGYPRYTKDIDVWIERSQENASKLISALDQFGFGSLGLRVDDFLKPEQVIQLGFPPSRIDILTSLTGVEFDTCFRERVTITVDEVEIAFIDLENLKANKRATGRYQDLADLENLE